MRALILGHSGGIGGALYRSFENSGYRVTGLSRAQGLDWRDMPAAEAALKALEGPFDVIVCATGVLAGQGQDQDVAPRGPEKSFKQIDIAQMQDVFAINTYGPALLLKVLPRLIEKERACKIAVLTARVGSIADNHLGGWYSYRASKAAANQLIRTAAIEMSRAYPKAALIAYHPGTVETQFTAGYTADKLSPDQAAAHLSTVLKGVTPEGSGQFLDWKGDTVSW